jgi:hypothetical protein
MICPTVAMLYLFCFIDRANIGTRNYQIAVVLMSWLTKFQATQDWLASKKSWG